MTRKHLNILFASLVFIVSAYFGLVVYQVQALIEAQPLAQCGYQLKSRSMPLTLVSAVIAQEDHGFLSHQGINWREVRQAFFANIQLGKIAYGASTIDMQVASLCYLKDKKLGKVEEKTLEIILVYFLAKRHSKAEILRAYLTIVPLAKNVRGFQAASQFYFDKPLRKLNFDEEWSLVLTLRNLNLLNPIKTSVTRKLPKSIRRQWLAAKWRQTQTISWHSTRILLIPFVHNKNLSLESSAFVEIKKAE